LSTNLFQQALHALWSVCGKRGVLPSSYIISEGVSRKDKKGFASGGFADVWKGELVERNFNRRKVCLKTIKVTVKDGQKGRKSNEKVGELPSFRAVPLTQFTPHQAFYEEASLWMRLKHPNVVQCFGATADPRQIVIDWMENGEVMKYVRKKPSASRTHLVSSLVFTAEELHQSTSRQPPRYYALPGVSITFIRVG
jgi:hypothetical protein